MGAKRLLLSEPLERKTTDDQYRQPPWRLRTVSMSVRETASKWAKEGNLLMTGSHPHAK